jgi:uncharacterized protein (DUF1697 family)
MAERATRGRAGGTHVALIRGINVGKAKRVAMADLRALVADLGYGNVRTLLNSGNVVFDVPSKIRGEAAVRISEAMTKRLGVSARVIVLSAVEVAAAVDANPLGKIADNPSRLFVAVLARPEDRRLLAPLAKQDWNPDALAIGRRVAYIWCANGLLESRLFEAASRALGDAVTVRNWATFSKLHAVAQADLG